MQEGIKTVDTQYKDLLKLVLDKGARSKSRMVDATGHETETIDLMAPPTLRFPVANGCPLITERKIGFWKKGIGELLAFIHGERTTEDLEKWGVNWWSSWCTPTKCHKRGLKTGDLGDGSYGAAFANFPAPIYEQKLGEIIPEQRVTTFNQFEAVLEQLKQNPELKTHLISPWIPYYNFRAEHINRRFPNKTVVQPCWGWYHFRVLNDGLHLNHWQRSADVPIGIPMNLVAGYALLLLIADILNLEPVEYTHQISDAHIYTNQLPWVGQLLTQPDRPLPDLKIINHHDSLLAYRPDDFAIENYDCGPAIKDIPVAI